MPRRNPDSVLRDVYPVSIYPWRAVFLQCIPKGNLKGMIVEGELPFPSEVDAKLWATSAGVKKSGYFNIRIVYDGLRRNPSHRHQDYLMRPYRDGKPQRGRLTGWRQVPWTNLWYEARRAVKHLKTKDDRVMAPTKYPPPLSYWPDAYEFKLYFGVSEYDALQEFKASRRAW